MNILSEGKLKGHPGSYQSWCFTGWSSHRKLSHLLTGAGSPLLASLQLAGGPLQTGPALPACSGPDPHDQVLLVLGRDTTHMWLTFKRVVSFTCLSIQSWSLQSVNHTCGERKKKKKDPLCPEESFRGACRGTIQNTLRCSPKQPAPHKGVRSQKGSNWRSKAYTWTQLLWSLLLTQLLLTSTSVLVLWASRRVGVGVIPETRRKFAELHLSCSRLWGSSMVYYPFRDPDNTWINLQVWKVATVPVSEWILHFCRPFKRLYFQELL